MRRRGLSLSQEGVQVPRTMNNTDDFHAAANSAVEYEIPCNTEIPQTGSQIWPRWAHVRIFSKSPARFVDPIKQPIGSGHVVLGNERPDLDKVLLRATCAV